MASAAVRPTHGRIRVTDVGLAVALTVFCVLVGRKQPLTFPAARPADAFQVVLIAVTCLALAVRRPFPAVAALVSVAGCAAYLGFGYTGGPVLLVPLVAMYLAGYAIALKEVWPLLAVYTALLVVAAIVTDAPAAQAWVWVL
ncbi:MAG TPA: hypothetical protein VHK64_02900, partial [Nocardioidaceae bacterium]|nr:hypothetical protein [Nocardioidaceae bacterium]